ncbi:MAG: HPr family phosphocarrier protein [Gammaproteobacteria bacterium]|nr:HPr family phosphocarrier protein [Gammaproteobacteria bacterium]
MVKKTLTIENKLGLHARAAAEFVKRAGRFSSSIQIACNGQTADGKSIMGIMMLAAVRGTGIELTIDGDDELDAMATLEALIHDRFGEDE